LRLWRSDNRELVLVRIQKECPCAFNGTEALGCKEFFERQFKKERGGKKVWILN